MEQIVRAGFIGAGGRAGGTHHPLIAKLSGVSIEAICELDQGKLAAAADRYGVARRYTDYRRMLDEVELDAIYAIMPPMGVAPIVIDCLEAGKHVFLEKPPGMNGEQAAAMLEAAERNHRLTLVGLQRRYQSVIQEARRLVLERGRPTMCLTEFHKCRLGQQSPTYGMSDMMLDVIHAIDLARYLCDGEAVEATSYRDTFFATFPNTFNCMIRFDSGATGIVTANRSTGGRCLRTELHGRGIATYADMPGRLEVQRDGGREPEVITAADLARRDGLSDPEGTEAMHRHFIDCIRTGTRPLTALQDVLHSVRLVERLDRDPAAGPGA